MGSIFCWSLLPIIFYLLKIWTYLSVFIVFPIIERYGCLLPVSRGREMTHYGATDANVSSLPSSWTAYLLNKTPNFFTNRVLLTNNNDNIPLPLSLSTNHSPSVQHRQLLFKRSWSYPRLASLDPLISRGVCTPRPRNFRMWKWIHVWTLFLFHLLF